MDFFSHEWVDELAPHVWRLTFPAEPTEASLADYVCNADSFYGGDPEPSKHCWVVDAAQVGGSTSSLRTMLADHLRRNEEVLGRTCLGMAVIVPTRTLRTILRAVLWLVSPPYPCVPVESLEAGLDWSHAQLAAADATKPPAARRECPNAIKCPLFPVFSDRSMLKIYQIEYCESRYAACARYRSMRQGTRPNQTLLPDGTHLTHLSPPADGE